MTENSINLIQNSDPINWTIIDLSGINSSWSKTSEGYIKQSTPLTNDYGSLLILNNDLISPDMAAVRTSQLLTGEVGLVFNYTDEQNFLMYVLQRKSENTLGGVLTSCINGIYSTVESTDFENSEDEVIIAVVYVENNLEIHIGELEVVKRTVEGLTLSKIGLYVNKNNDIHFLNLFQGALEPASETEDDESTIPTPKIIELENKEIQLEDKLDNYLSIGTPKSETQVEFDQVFTVPLDSFYVSLYRNYGEKPIRLSGEFASQSNTNEEGKIDYSLDGSFFIAYSLSPDKFIVLGAKGFNGFNDIKFPFTSLYAALIDKSTLKPIKEFEKTVDGNKLKGFLPISEENILSVNVSLQTELINTSDSKVLYAGNIIGAQYSPSGDFCIGKDIYNRDLVLFKVSDGKTLITINVSPTKGNPMLDVRDFFFSPDESIVIGTFASVDSRSTILIWNVSTGELIKELEFTNRPMEIIFSNNSKYCLIPGGALYQFFDTSSWTNLGQFNGQSHSIFNAPRFTPDSLYIQVYHQGGSIELYDTNSGTFYKSGDFYVQWAVPIGDTEILFSHNDKLQSWDFKSGKKNIITTVDPFYSHMVTQFDLSTDRFFIKHNSQLDVIRILDKKVDASFTVDQYRPDIKFSNDGTKIIPKGTAWNTDVKIYHLGSTPHVSPNMTTRFSQINEARCTTDGSEVLVRSETSKLDLWNTQNGNKTSLGSFVGIQDIAVSPSGDSVLIQRIMADIHQVDANTLLETEENKLPLNLEFLNTGMGPLIASPDGSKLLYPGGDRTPVLWDFVNKKSTNLDQLKNFDFSNLQIFFSKDSNKIVTTRGDYNFVEYKLGDTNVQQFDQVKISGNPVKIRCLCYEAVGKGIFTYHEDGVIRLWTNNLLSSAQKVFTDIHTDKGKYIGVSPNGKLLFLLRDTTISVISIFDGVITDTIDSKGSLPGFAVWFTPDSLGIAVCNSKDLTVYPLKLVDTTVSKDTPREDMPSSFAYLLDYRPKRWYRQLKQAYDQEQHFKGIAKKFHDVIFALSTAMFSRPADIENDTPSLFSQINTSLSQLNEYQKKQNEAETIANKALDVQQTISSELRLNGYNLVYTETTANETRLFTYQNGKKRYFKEAKLRIQEELENRGFKFAVIGGRPKVKPYKAFKFDPNLNIADNAIWGEFWGKLRAHLSNEDALTDEKREAFEIQSKELFNTSVNQKIQQNRKKLNTDIQLANDTVKKLRRQVSNHKQIRSKWEDDIAIIEALNYSSFKLLFNSLTIEHPKLVYLKSNIRLSDSTWDDTIVKTRRYGPWFWRRTATYTFARTNYDYLINFSLSPPEKGGFYTGWRYGTGRFHYNKTSGLSIGTFKEKILSICSVALDEIDEAIAALMQDINKFKNEVSFHKTALDNLLSNSLTDQRKKFIAYWNDPNQFGAMDTLQNEIMPEADPLTDLLVSLQYPEDEDVVDSSDTILKPLQELKWKTDFFNFSGDRFYNEEGLTLQSYLEFLKGSKSKRVAIFPKMEDDGSINDDAFIAVVNPQPALNMDEDLPVIKFVETYRIGIRWKGHSMGELSHTENLFPNETKEIKIERTIKLVSKQEESRSDSRTSKTKNSSSFEENLQTEISLKELSSQEQEATTESSITNTSETESENDVTDTKELNFDVKITDFVPGVSGGLDSKNSTVKKKKDSKKDTFEKSQKQTGKTANKESREAFSKDTSNTIRKIANETSQENKVEIKVNSSEEHTSSSTRTETINIENPNMGRTINYQFFQVQNGYEVTTNLTDVKVVVDMNREIIKGSTVTDIRVFDLEEMGKIFSDETEDPRYMLTAAIIARQAFKNYLGGVPGTGRGNEALRIKQGFVPDTKMLEVVNFSKKLSKDGAQKDNLFGELNEAMDYLKQVPFEFQETEITTPKEFYINAGSYYLDSEVGNMAATEQYLEDRRDIETSKQRVEVERLNKMIENGVFHPDIPDSVTHLNYDSDGNQV